MNCLNTNLLLSACGFAGLWRFAGPFSKSQSNLDSAELFVNCLEAMVETCLPIDEGDNVDLTNYSSGLCISSTSNLSSSMSSLTLGSPTDKDAKGNEYHINTTNTTVKMTDYRSRHAAQLRKQRSFKCKETNGKSDKK